MPGSLRTYAFINAKLKTRISGILTDAFYRNMVRTQTLNEAVSQLAGTPYEELVRIYNETGDLKMCELSLYRQEIGLYWEVERHVKDSVLAFVQALSTRYEIYNLKNALRIWFDRSVRHRNVALEASYLCRDRVHFAIDFDAVVAAENLEEIAELLGGTPYGRIVADGAGQVATAGSLFPVEVALDHHYFAQVFQATEQLPARDAEIARRMIGVEVDLQNVSWLARMRRFYKLESDRLQEVIIPHGLNLELSMLRQDNGDKEPVDLLLDLVTRKYAALKPLLSGGAGDQLSRLGLIESVLEEIATYEVRRALAGNPFTIGIILSYFVLKQRELRKLVSILNAKNYELTEERSMGLL